MKGVSDKKHSTSLSFEKIYYIHVHCSIDIDHAYIGL